MITDTELIAEITRELSLPELDEWRVVEIGAALVSRLGPLQAPLGNSRLRGIDHERE
jgi:hypothetical protein